MQRAEAAGRRAGEGAAGNEKLPQRRDVRRESPDSLFGICSENPRFAGLKERSQTNKKSPDVFQDIKALYLNYFPFIVLASASVTFSIKILSTLISHNPFAQNMN